MAYTTSPEKDTYSTQQISAAYNLDTRPNSYFVYSGSNYQDAGMINFFPVKQTISSKEEEVTADQRLSIIARITTTDTGEVNRGCYVWEKSDIEIYYFVVNRFKVLTSTDQLVWTHVNTIANGNTPVRFTEFIDGTNTKKLVMVDGSEGYVFTSNAAGTKITDADFPSPHVPFPVFIDGYLFLAKAGTGDIYNSDLNDPSSWTAGNFISSEVYPDDIKALVKVDNYLLAIGAHGSEYFQDIGNASGSPLAKYEGGILPFGTIVPNSIAANKNQIVLIAQNNDGQPTIKLIEGFKYRDISPSFLLGALNYRITNGNTTASAVRGYFLRQQGKLYYVLAFEGKNQIATPVQNGVYAYSFDVGWWVELRYGTQGDKPFPVYFTTLPRKEELSSYVSGHIDEGIPFFGQLEEGLGSGDIIYYYNSGDYIGQSIYGEIRTPRLDFGTLNLKFASRLGIKSVLGNPTQLNPTNYVYVYWSDDDGVTFTGPYEINIQASRKWPFIAQLGSFRQRMFKFVYYGGTYLRIRGFEIDINKGQQ